MKQRIIIYSIFLVIVASLSGVIWHYYNQAARCEIKNIITDDSLQKVKDSGKLIIGTSAVFEPMIFKNAKGNLEGFEVDLADEIASRLDLKIEYKIMPFADLFGAVANSQVDIAIDGITITPERSKKVLFSAIYFTTGQSIVTRAENDSIYGSQDLTDKKIGVWKGTTCEEAARKISDSKNIVVYENHEEIAGLKKGEVEAIIIDNINALAIVKNDASLKIAGKILNEEYYGIVAKKSNSTLMSEINRTINSLRASGNLQKIGEKWGIVWK